VRREEIKTVFAGTHKERLDALRDGRIKVANLQEPWISVAEKQGCRVLIETRSTPASPDRRLMQPRRRWGSRCAKPLSAARNKSSSQCARLKMAVRPALTCCPRRCCSRCEGRSSSLLRSLGYLRYISGQKRRMRVV